MTELKLVRNAAGWLRRFGIAVSVLIFSLVITFSNFGLAQSTDTGANSVLDYSLTFNEGRSDQVAEHPDGNFILGQTNVTWEAWIFQTSRNVAGTVRAGIFSKEMNFVLGTDSGRLWSAFQTGGNVWNDNIYTRALVPLNTWTHVAFVKAGTTMRVFMNGQLVEERANAAPQTINGNEYLNNGSPYRFSIGRRHNGEAFVGRIDEVRVWESVVRTEAQIAANMHTKVVAGNASGLVGYWDFNEPPGTQLAYDRNTGGYTQNLSLVNSPTRTDVKTVSSNNLDTVITFPRTYLPGVGGWTVPQNITNVQAFLAGGGGGGGGGGYRAGSFGGGGGGGAAGRVALLADLSLTSGSTRSVQVGQGGLGGAPTNYVYWEGLNGLSGQSSTFGSSQVLGGAGAWGAGKTSNATRNEWNLGRPYNDGAGGEGGSNANFAGGLGWVNLANLNDSQGPGGGGAGSAANGASATSTTPGSGGAGTSFVGATYAIGGAGGLQGTSSQRPAASIASANTGNGGEGGAGAGWNGANIEGRSGANGAAGVVIVRYRSLLDQALSLPGSSTAFLNGTRPTIPSGQFTVETWAYLNSNSGVTFFSEGVGHPSSNVYLATLGDGTFYTRWGTTERSTGITAPMGRWFHVALVRGSDNKPTLFLDGVSVWTDATANSSAPDSGGAFRVGIQTGNTSPLNGQLDNVKVWTGALTSAQIQASMHSYGATQSSGVAVASGVTLRAHYDFNEFNQGVELDRSGNGYDLVASTGISSSSYTDSRIIESGTAHSIQTTVRFNRTYLTANGGWTTPSNVSRYKAVVVGGGGAGGSRHAGGGGAGALLVSSSTTLPSVVPIRVGQGGVGNLLITNHNGNLGGASGQSSFLGATELKGGGGGAGALDAAKSGGSGGGLAGTGTAAPAGSGLGLKNAGGVGANNGVQYTGGGGGGAMSTGLTATATQAGQGGQGYVSVITGTPICFAAGGGGGGTSGATAGAGGACVSGDVNSTVATSAGSGTNQGYSGAIAGSGLANSGSGGGAGGLNSDSGRSGSGGSGVVILSYGPYLEVTRTPFLTRVGSAFSQSLQVQLTNLDGTLFSSNSPVTVTSSAALILNGVLLTQSLTVNAVNGVATFDGLGFASSVTSAQTLTFTSNAFVGTSVTITPTFFANNLVINASNASTGFMFEGEFYASSSAGISYLNVSDLHANAVANTISISVSGSISISSAVNVSISGRSVTFRAGGDIHVGNVNLLTQGPLNFISDTDGSGSGSFNSDTSSLINSRGGQIFISGGLTPESGYAVGSKNSQWSGVRILGDLWSEGGDIVIRGDSGASVTTADVTAPNWTAGVLLGSKTVDSGTGSISISGAVNRSSDNSEVHYGVSIGTSDASVNGTLQSSTGGISIRIDSSPSSGANKEGFGLMRASVLSDTGAITISAIASGAAYEIDVDNGRASIVSTSGSITLEGRGAGSEDLGSLVLSSPALISIRGDKPEINSGFVITSSPIVAIESFGSSFSAVVNTTNMSIGSATRGFRLGKTTNTAAVTLGSSMSINGPIEVYGSDISVTNKPNLVVTSQSARLLFKATRNIDVVAGTATSDRSLLQTNNGDIILWVNSANGGSGYLYLGNFAVLNSANGLESKTGSGGGRITMAGGSATDSTGHPTGGIPGFSQAGNYEGLWVAPSVKVYSGGGDVYIAVAHTIAGYQAAAFRASSLIWSGNGRITASVSHTATSGTSRGIELADTTWVSAATSSPAISITARVSNGSHAIYQSSGESFTLTSLASEGGGISVSALTPVTTNTALFWYGFDILSRTGEISVFSNGVSNWNSTQARDFGAATGTDVLSSSATISIQVEDFLDATANNQSAISTSSRVQIRPNSSNFASTDTQLYFRIDAGSVILGNSSNLNSSTVTWNSRRGIRSIGPIEIYGNRFALREQSDLQTTGLASTVLMRLKDGMYVDAGSGDSDAGQSRIWTNLGDLIVWADTDGDGSGGIVMEAFTDLNTANGVESTSSSSLGGRILLGGGSSVGADGYPTGNAGTATWGYTNRSIHTGQNVDIYSGGGDIRILGKSNSSYGVVMYFGTDIVSGVGAVELRAETTGSGTGFYLDEAVNNVPFNIVSYASSSPAISFSGIAASSGDGLRLWGSSSNQFINFISPSSVGGGITLNGVTGGTRVNVFQRLRLLSAAGEIRVNGGAKQTYFDGSGTSNIFGSDPSSPYVSTSSASVTFTSDTFEFSVANTSYNTSGEIMFLPHSNNFFSADQVFGQKVIGTGGLTIGRQPLSGDTHRIVYLRESQSVSGEVKIYGGDIIIGDSNYAVQITGSSSVSLVARSNIRIEYDQISSIQGNIHLQARSTNAAEGGVLAIGSTFNTFAGRFLASGGASPLTDFAIGTAERTEYLGVAIYVGSGVYTRGGDIIIRGSQGADNDPDDAVGVYLDNSVFSSGNGDIQIYGRLADQPFTSGSAEHSGILTYGAQITSTGGDIEIFGDASAITGAKGDKRGLLFWPVTVTSQTGNISISGTLASVGADSYDLQVVTASTIRSRNGNVEVRASGAGGLITTDLTVDSDRTILIEDDLPNITTSTVTGSAVATVQPTTNSFQAAFNPAGFTFNPLLSGLTIGKSTSTAGLTINQATTINGPVHVLGGAVTISGNITSTTNSALIRVKANTVGMSAVLSATRSGRVIIANQTPSRPIHFRGTQAGVLILPSNLNTFVSATTLQVGDSTSGDITVNSGGMTFTNASITNLLLVTPGAVLSAGGATLTAPNLAIDAGGGVNLPGSNSVSGAVAISASSMVTYSSAVSYSAATVDNVLPVFGIGRAISQTNSPSVQDANEFLAVTFNPPPQVVITDAYNKVLDGNNRTAYTYTVSASVASGSGVVQGLTSSSRVGGLVTFNAMKVTSGIGVYAFTFSAELSPSSTITTRSVDYNVMAGEPGELAITATDTSSPAGQLGFDITVTVKDSQGNPLTSGPNSGLTVSATISGSGGVIVSGNEAAASTSNAVADFSNLVVGGSTALTYSLSFSVTYTDVNNQQQTLTSSPVAISLTPGPAYALSVSPSSLVATYSELVDPITVRVLDSYSNVVTTNTSQISISAVTAQVYGTSVSNAVAGTFVFNDLRITGTKATHTLTFTSAGVRSASAVIDLKYLGRLTLARNADFGIVGKSFGIQPLIQVLDSAGATSTANDLSISAAISAGSSLQGVSEVSSSAGLGSFTSLALASGTLGQSYDLTFSAPGYDSVTQSTIIYAAQAGDVDVTTAGTTQGAFLSGLFYATANPANINRNDLNSQFALGSVEISASGTIDVTASISSSVTGSNLTLKSVGSISATAGVTTLQGASVSAISGASINWVTDITTNGGNVWFQSRASGAATGDVVSGGIINTTGGNVYAFGGQDPFQDYAVARETGNGSGVYMSSRVNTGGGDILIRGSVNTASSAAGQRGAWLMSSLIATSGGDITVSGRVVTRTNSATVEDAAIEVRGTVDVGSGNLHFDVNGAQITNAARERIGVYLYLATIRASTGNITINSDLVQLQTSNNVFNRWLFADSSVIDSGSGVFSGNSPSTKNELFLKDSVVSSSGAVSITTGGLAIETRNHFKGPGTFIFEPSGTGFVREVFTHYTTFSNEITYLRFGKPLGQADSSFYYFSGKQIDVNGPLVVNGERVQLYEKLKTSSSSAEVSIVGSYFVHVFGGGVESAGSISISSLVVSNSAPISASGNVTIKADPRLWATVSSAVGQIYFSAYNGSFSADMPQSPSADHWLLSSKEMSLLKTPKLVTRANNLYLRMSVSPQAVSEWMLEGETLRTWDASQISASNVAISLSRSVDLPGLNRIKNLAIASPLVTYSSAIDYLPTTVSGVTPRFGVPASIVASKVPTNSPTSIYAGATVSPAPIATVRDANGLALQTRNLLARTVTVSAAVATGNATLANTSSSSISGGVQEFTNLRIIDGSGDVTLAFTLNSADGQIGSTVTTGTYRLSNPDPASLSVVVSDASAGAGLAGFGIAVTVRADDNTALAAGPNSGITVSASVSGQSVQIVSGAKVRTNGSGVADFSQLKLSGSVSDSISISFSVNFIDYLGAEQTISSIVYALNLTPGDAKTLVIDDDSQSVANRSTFSAVTISLLDAYGNKLVSRSDTVTATIGSGSGANLVGTKQIVFPAGANSDAEVTFDNLALQGTIGNYRIDFASNQAGISSVSHEVTLTYGAATRIALDTQASGARAGISFTQQPKLSLRDADSNIVPGDVSISAAVTGPTLTGTQNIALTAGYATFSDLAIQGAAQSYGIQYEVTAPVGFTSFSVSQTIALAAGIPYKFAWEDQPANATAGVNQQGNLKISLRDQWNNITSQSQTVSVEVALVSATDSAQVRSVMASYSVSPFATSFSFLAADSSVNLTGTYRLKVSATSFDSAVSDQFVIGNAAPSKLVVLQDVPATIRSGITFSPALKVEVLDSFNNRVVDRAISLSASVISGSAISLAGEDVELVSGSSSVEFPDLAIEAKAANLRLRVSLGGAYAASNISISSGVFAVTFGAPNQLTVSPAARSVANRTAIDEILVKVLDSAGNQVDDSTALISVTTSGLVLTGTLNRYGASGASSFSDLVPEGAVGNYVLSFESAGLSGATVSLTVTHGAAYRLTVTDQERSRNNTVLRDISVQILDRDFNLVATGPQSDQTVTIGASGAVLSGVTAVSASAGLATFSGLVLTGSVSDQVSISTSIQLPFQIENVSRFEIQPGDPHSLDLTTLAAGFANREAFGTAPAITVRDISGNVVPSSGMDVRVTVDTASISGSITASAETGYATFSSNLVLRGLAGSHTLVFTAEGTSSSGVVSASQTILLNHGAASQLVVTRAASNVWAGQNFGVQPKVELRDPEGNRVSTSNLATATIDVSYSGAGWSAQNRTGVSLLGARAISLSAGIGEFTNLEFEGRVGSYTLDFVVREDQAISTSDVVAVESGTPVGINVLVEPQDIIAGEAFANTLSAEIIDDFDNRVVRVTSSATLKASLITSTPTTAVITESAEFEVNAGVATFSGLTFTSAGTRYLQFDAGPSSSLQNISGRTTYTFLISHAAPDEIVWVTQPVASVQNWKVVTGQGGPYPKLKAVDRFGNLASSATMSVDVSVDPSVQAVEQNGRMFNQGYATFDGLKIRATSGSYTVKFEADFDSGPVFSSISHVIEVTYGDPDYLDVATHPSTARAGTPFATQPVIEIRDSGGNLVENSTLSVTVTAQGAALTGQTQATAVTGVATFTGVELSGSISSTVTLSYTANFNGQAIEFAEETLVLNPGTADYMTLHWTAADIQTRAAISPAPEVKLWDEFGNLVTLDSSTQVVAKLMRLGSVVTTSTQVFTANAGVVDFTGLTFIATPNQGYSLRFESTGLDVVSSSAVTVLPGPVARVEIIDEPGSGAGATQARTGNALPQQPRIKLVDFDGNIVTTVNAGSITAQIASGQNGTVVSASASISAGIAQFTQLGLIGRVATPTQSAEVYRLEFAYQNFTSSPSAQLTLKHNVAEKIVQIQDAVGGQAGLDFATQPKVKVVDRFGNTVYDDSSITILAIPEVAAGTGQASVAGSNQAQTDASGIATFDMGISGSVNNTYKLTFKDFDEQLITASQSGIVITPGQARQLYILRAASATDANQVRTKTGQAFLVQPVIEIRDDYGNRVNSNATITVSLSSTVRGARDYLKNYTISAQAGVATFSGLAMVVLPETNYQLTYKFGGNTTAFTQTEPLWVTHADAEYITIERQPQGGNKTGNSLSLSPSVTVRDFDGNPTTMISGETVSAVISQGNGWVTANGDATVVAGVATFNNLTLVALPGEAQRLRFELQGFNNSASSIVKSVDSDAITLTFSDAHQLSVIQQPSANAITAELLGTQPQVVVQDRFGNTVSNYVGSVWVESQAGSRLVDAQDQTIGSISAVVVNGVATFNTVRIEGDANQSFALSFASGALATTTSNAVTLGHTSAAYLTVTSQPVGAVTGQLLANQPEVRIFDRFDNLLDTDNSSQITVSVFSGDTRPGGQQAEISGSRTVTVQGGVATFTGLKFTGRVGSDYIWQFSDGVRTVNSNTVRVSAAGAYSFEWVQLPQVDRTGELMPTPAVLRALDFDGNLAVSSSDTVTVTVTGGGYIESGTTSQIVNGYATFSNLILVATPAVAQQLTFTATAGNQSFAISTQQNLVLRHTTASELRINRSPSALGQQGSSFASQPQIHLYDRYGNKAIYDNSTVVTAAIASGVGGATTGSATVAANAGEANFSTLGITGSPGVAYTLNYAANLGFSITDNTALKVFKTADIQLSYPTVNFSLSATVAPTVAVTDSTEKPLVFTSRTTQYCTVNGSTGVATIVSAGTCEINVSVADGAYFKQNSIDVNLVINRALQAPLLMTNPNFVDFGQVLTLTHSGGSSTATPEYYATGTCRAFGNQLMFSGDATEGSTASCTVRVIQDGDQNFEDALSPAQRITVKRIGQEQLRIGNSRETAVGDVELFTVGGSGGGSVSYRVEVGQGTATCAIVDGNKLRATTNGWCEVSAQKAMSVNYNTASSPVVVFTFSKQVQVVSFTSPAPGMLLPGQSYQVAANASSGLTVSFAVTRGLEVQASQNTSYSPAVCSISGNTVTLIGTGTCEVTATQAGNAQFAQASAKLILTVGQLNQFIDFAQPQDLTYGSPVTRLGAIASSGLPVSYTTSNGVTACSVSTAGLLTLNSAGDCTVVASQGGDGRYAAAAPVTRTLRVLPDRASAPALVSAAVGNQWFTVGYTEPSYTGGSPIIGYRLEVTDSVSGDRYVNSACSINAPLTCTMLGLPNARSYSAKVAAITAAGTGRFSANTTNLVPTSAQISVTQLQADISGANLVMNWTPPAVVSGTFQRYEIYVWPTGGTVPTTPTATVNTLSATTTAVDVSSMSPNSTISQIANLSQPVFVSAFNVRSRVVIFGAVNQGPMGFIRLASSQSPVVIDPAAGFQMRVVTITDEHSSSQTINTATGEKLGMGSPEAPTQLTLDSTDPTKLIASWGAPGFDGGLPVIDYEVRSNGQVICANITTRMCEISPLEVSTTYRIEVRARNSIGFGGTASAQHTTPTPPPPQLLGGAELASKTPVFTSYSQRVLPLAGAKVLVEGTRLQMIQAMSIAGKTVSYSFISNSQLELEVPALPAGTYDLVVLGEHGRLVIVDAFTFVQEPEKLTSIRGYVDGFLGKSTTLGKLNISRIEALFSKVPGADTVRCIGSIPTKAKISEIRLAKKRAEKTCAFIEKQYPGVKVTRSWVWRDGVLDFKRGQVRIILTTELLKGTI